MFSEAKSKVDLEIAFVELESAFALFAMSVLMGIWVRSPVFNLSCDRSFSDISADGVLSAIVFVRFESAIASFLYGILKRDRLSK